MIVAVQPGTDRTSYAGTVVNVLERLDGRLEEQHHGRDIPSQEAPPRPSILRDLAGRTGHTVVPYPFSKVNGNGLSGKSVTELATPDPIQHVGELIAVAGPNGTSRVRKSASPPRRKPTPLQTARWKAVQEAKGRGLSIRGIARELGIHKGTAKKQMNAKSPPITKHQPGLKDS